LIENIIPLLFDDEDDEDDEEPAEIVPVPKCDYVESVVPRQTDIQFREDFRLTRATFTVLQEKLSKSLNNPNDEMADDDDESLMGRL
jgi:hypothetical protein